LSKIQTPSHHFLLSSTQSKKAKFSLKTIPILKPMIIIIIHPYIQLKKKTKTVKSFKSFKKQTYLDTLQPLKATL